MSHPAISISLPVYNGARELEDRLDNIAAQTFGDFQVFLLDNASTDGTEIIGRRYAARDARFTYLRLPRRISYNHAVIQNVYRGLGGEYLILTSHSQRWAAAYLEECLKALGDNPQAVAAYSWCQFLDGGEPWPADLPGGLAKDGDELSDPDAIRRVVGVIERQKYYTPIFGLVRTEPYWRLRGSPTPERMLWEFYSACVLALEAPLTQIERPLFFRRWQPGDESVLESCRRHVGRPAGLRPTAVTTLGGYQSTFLSSLGFCLGLGQMAWNLSVDQREELARQAVGAWLRRYRPELEAEMDANIALVEAGRFYSWRGYSTEYLTDKIPRPSVLPHEDGEQAPSRPALDASVAREINTLIGGYLMFCPTHPGLKYALGLTYYVLGRRAEAKAALASELQNNPDYEPARQKLREWADSEG